MFLKVSIALIYVVALVLAQDEPSECLRPLAFGKICDTAEPSIKWHFDNDTKMCMAFKFNGCGGNKNRFDDFSSCKTTCSPLGRNLCPANTKSFDTSCKTDSECPSNGYCKMALGGGGQCCRIAARDKIDSDYAGSCAAARQVSRVDEFVVLIGKSCASNFCPAGANCKEGHFFATCCELKN